MLATGLAVACLLVAAPLSAEGGGGNCDADAGTLSGYKPTDCLQAGGTLIGGIPNGDSNVPSGYQTAFVLTEGPDLVIQDAGPSPIFNVTSTGSYTIHTLVYDPNTLDLGIVVPGVTTGFDVNALLVQGGGGICASLDVTGTSVLVDDPDAGTLTADDVEVCLDGGSALVSATPNGDGYVPTGYQTLYVLTSGSGLVIVNVGSMPEFTVSDTGSYTLHTLVYDPATLDLSGVTPGVTTGFDVNGLLIQGGGGICAALDVTGAPLKVVYCPASCEADAGTLTTNAFETCLVNDTAWVSATSDGNSFVPVGYQVLYVLTEGAGLVIQQVSATPEFLVGLEGDYTIHTLVYDPVTLDLSIVTPGVTTGFDVNALLIQGGGSICASLDVAGAPTLVVDCPPTCSSDAGTLTATPDNVCLDQGQAELLVSPDGNAFIPSGFQQIYVLTIGADLVIQAVSGTPSFTVADTGVFTIHTLVYDPQTLDLGIVTPGVTTGFDVNALLIQGGGDLCGSLDVNGARVEVNVCSTCDAMAGTLVASQAMVCLDGASAMLEATTDLSPMVPGGFQVVYVLTSGSGLVIQNAGPTPNFLVNDTGSYTIHTLVYDSTTLDLGIVVPGVTTGFDVNGLLVQGGGPICASLDVEGAPIMVVDCAPDCEADAGTITSDAATVCLDGGVGAQLSATPDGNAFVPNGYQTLYVLTSGSGLVIEAVSSTPVFQVSDTGSYTIHTLVYDPATLDLGIVEPGVTTGFDVNGLLVQGGGTICAALDVAGAPVVVQDCPQIGQGPVALASSYLLKPDLSFWPNPARSALELVLNNVPAGRVEIMVIDQMGRQVMAPKVFGVEGGMFRTTLDVAQLPAGMHHLVVSHAKGRISERFMTTD